MPTTQLTPSATGFYNTGWVDAFGSKPTNVQPPDDDDTSFIRWDNVGGQNRQSFVMTDLPVGAATVISHTAFHRTKNTDVANAGASNFIRSAGVDTDGPSDTLVNGGAWATFSHTNILALTVSAVNAAELGVLVFSGVPGEIGCTTLGWDVTWAPSPGGFAFIIGQYLGPLVAVGLYETPKLAREVYVRSRRRILLERHELKQAWLELCAPRRIYC